MSATQPNAEPQVDPRGRWIGITTPDGLTVQGSELDGFHVQYNGIVKASYYAGEAGTCPFAALDAWRALEAQRRAMGTE